MNEYKYYIKKTEKPAFDVVVLELADFRGVPVFDFKPGQYVMIAYKNAQGRMQEKHTFSIASSPLKKDSIRLGIRILGKFTTQLAQLPVGYEIFVSGPFGNFVFDEQQHGEAVFIAGGVGITPFISSLAYAADKQLVNRMDILYSRTLKGAVFADEIMDIARKCDNIRSLISITDETFERTPEHISTKRIGADAIGAFIGRTQGKTFFLCGPVSFMDAMRKNLAAIGVDESQIRAEEFSMIPDTSLWLRVRNMTYALSLAAVLFVAILYAIRNVAQQRSINSGSFLGVTNSSQTNTGTANVSQTQQAPTTVLPSHRTRVS